jgi:hypothetical protein
LEESNHLRLGENQLTGSVPSEVCRLHLYNFSGLAILVDCLEVACDCNCSNADAALDDLNYYDNDQDAVNDAPTDDAF